MEKILTDISNKLDLIIKILILNSFKDLNKSDKIKSLFDLGIQQKDIAAYLNVPISTVTGRISEYRKSKKKG